LEPPSAGQDELLTRFEAERRTDPAVTDDDSVTLTNGSLAPARARAWVSERAGGLDSAFMDDALLIASELVTNAVRHGSPQIVLSVREVPGGLRIEVGDEGSTVPVPTTRAPDTEQLTGRGLLIVAATSHDWGIAPHPDRPGKTVWAELLRP
jgi:hypothetical protein